MLALQHGKVYRPISLLPEDMRAAGSREKKDVKDGKRSNSSSGKVSVPWPRMSARAGVMADTEGWKFLSDYSVDFLRRGDLTDHPTQFCVLYWDI